MIHRNACVETPLFTTTQASLHISRHDHCLSSPYSVPCGPMSTTERYASRATASCSSARGSAMRTNSSPGSNAAFTAVMNSSSLVVDRSRPWTLHTIRHVATVGSPRWSGQTNTLTTPKRFCTGDWLFASHFPSSQGRNNCPPMLLHWQPARCRQREVMTRVRSLPGSGSCTVQRCGIH